MNDIELRYRRPSNGLNPIAQQANRPIKFWIFDDVLV
jgi:hypothetical protein